jgi:hypothetical protein
MDGTTPAGVDYQSVKSTFDIAKEKDRGYSFGLGRQKMQQNNLERQITWMKDYPGPNYDPKKIGTRLGIDAVKYSMGVKLEAIDRNQSACFNLF